MKKDELEMMYLIGWVIATCLTFLVSYLYYPMFIIPLVVAHYCAIKIIFRIDDDSDRGGDDDIPEPAPEPGLELDIPKDDLTIKRGGNDLNKKKNLDKYDYSQN
jgi:hypothetical protein